MDPGSFQVALTAPNGFPGEIAVAMASSLLPGGTNESDEFIDWPPSVIFRNSAPVHFNVKPQNDCLPEPRRYLTISLVDSPGNPYSIDPTGASAGMYVDDNDNHYVNVIASQPYALESGELPGQLTFTRYGNGDLHCPVTVNYSVTGTATPGSTYDYEPLTGQVTIPANSTSVTVLVVPNDDTVENEGWESVNVTVAQGSGTSPGNSASTTVWILDNDGDDDWEDEGSTKPRQIPPSCETCPPQQDLVRGNGFGVSRSFGPTGQSLDPVRYADGTVNLSFADLDVTSLGVPWGLTRSWTNGNAYAPHNVVGHGMLISEQPFLLSYNNGNQIGIVSNGLTVRYFNRVNNEFVPSFFLQEKLEQDGNEYILTDTTGAQIRFYGMSTDIPAAQRGQVICYTDPNGNKTEVVDYTADDKIKEIKRTGVDGDVSVRDSFYYNYVPTGVNQGLIASVTYKQGLNGADPITKSSASYTYYGTSDSNGNLGDLKSVTVAYGNGGTDTTYYRYYKAAEANGYEHALKMVFRGASYARLKHAFTSQASIDSQSDATILSYADNYFEYDGDHRVVKEIAQGAGGAGSNDGQGTYLFDYQINTYANGANEWNVRTTETLPDLNKNIVYTNSYGQVMLQVFQDTTTNQEWSTFYQYDGYGRVVMIAEPSAVNGYNEATADLLNEVNGNYQYLNDSSGLITVFSYYSHTSVQDGAAEGYLEEVRILNGETANTANTNVPQLRNTYVANEADEMTVYHLASQTVYANINYLSPLTTALSYTFFPGTHQIKSQTTTKVEQGDTTEVVYDAYGRPVWSADERGYLTYIAYDAATGAVAKTIDDVNDELTDTFRDKPSNFGTPTDGGLHLTTKYVVDSLGRPTQITDANGNKTYTVYNDAAREMRIYPGWDTTGYHPTGPTIVMREDRTHGEGYVETLTMSASPGSPLGSEPISGIQSLSRTYLNRSGQPERVEDYFNVSGISYSTGTNLGTLNTHFYRTTLGYDERGRLDRTQRGDGTIFRTVHDSLGRPISEWIGTSDANWPDITGASDMTRTQAYIYDQGGVGNSNVTSVIDALDNTTTIEYDFRDRPFRTTLPDPDGPNEPLIAPVYATFYDNLDRVIGTSEPEYMNVSHQYNPWADNFEITTAWGVGDDQHIVRTYDARGLLISETDPMGRVTNYEYDGARRLRKTTSVDADHPDESPATMYQYDNVGNVRFVIDPLAHQTERVYDKADRLTDVYEPAPLESSIRPNTHYDYDSGGRLYALSDPNHNSTRWFYDALGRVTQETNELSYSRYFEYDAASRLTSRTDRLGRNIMFDYNTLDQVRHEYWYEGPDIVRTITNEYDDAGQVSSSSQSAINYDPTATNYSYSRDYLGRVTGQTQNITGLPEITYVSAYNAASSRTSLTAAIGTAADFQNVYQYDGLQRLTNLTQSAVGGTGSNSVSGKWVDFTYNAANQVTSITRSAATGGHTRQSNSYDALGRLSRLVHSQFDPPPTSGFGSDTLAGYQYTYDLASRLTSINSYTDGLTSYGYDHTNQITSADHASQNDESYSYDLNGNRTSGGHITTASNQLQSDGTYSYMYDAEGNRIRKTEIATGKYSVYKYDHRNRLVHVEDIDPTQGQYVDWDWGDSSASITYEESHTEPDSFGGDSAYEWWYEEDPVTFGVWWVSYSVSVQWGVGSYSISSSGWPTEITVDEYPCEPQPGAPCSFTVHVQAVDRPASSTLEARIYHPDDQTYTTTYNYTTYSAAVASAIEGSDVVLSADTSFDYCVADRSAHVTEGDYNAPPEAICDNWLSAYGQVFFPTSNIDSWQGTRSFAVYVRLADHPDVVWELEADIYDTNDAVVETVDYSYDTSDQLVRRRFDDDGPFKAHQQADTYFSWENGQINLQFDGASTAPSHRYLWNPLAIDHLLADENALNEVLLPLTDHLGTIRDLAKLTAGIGTTVVSHRLYDSFGRLLNAPDPDDTTPFGFTGVYFDHAIGHGFHRARWYDPTTGRWITEDPSGFNAGDTNLQRYVGNNPVNYVDPSGLEGEGVGWENAQFADGPSSSATLRLINWLLHPYEVEAPKVYDNCRAAGDSKAKAFGNAARTALGTTFGVRYLDDWAHRNDAVDGHEQTSIERGMKFWSGSAQLATAGFSGAQIVRGMGLIRAPAPLAPSSVARIGAMDTIPEGNRLITYYPSNRGLLGNTVKETLQPGVLVDRFGLDRGSFVAPVGTPLGARALAPGGADAPYSVFRVVKPIETNAGTTAPWFGQPGLGRQYELPARVSDLLKSGHLERVEP